jgi:hypothetical protein
MCCSRTGVFLAHCEVSMFALDVSNIFFLIICNCKLHNPDIKGAQKEKGKKIH